MASSKKSEFMMKKIQEARQDAELKMAQERKQIDDYELEAQQLEMMEAELLQKLQNTQQVERNAFGKLESAMIDASMPKKMRVVAGES